MTYIIGLTGGIGSGKSAAAHLFADLGATLVDTDIIAHELTGPGGAAMPALRLAFGESVAAADGRLDRAAMRARVFSDPAAKAQLEAILHPRIRSLSAERCAAASGPYAVLVVPLLVESADYAKRVQRIAVVDCTEETQVRRVMARSGLSADEVARIMAAQASRQARLAVADDVIDNDGPLASLAPQVAALHRHYLALAGAI